MITSNLSYKTIKQWLCSVRPSGVHVEITHMEPTGSQSLFGNYFFYRNDNFVTSGARVCLMEVRSIVMYARKSATTISRY